MVVPSSVPVFSTSTWVRNAPMGPCPLKTRGLLLCHQFYFNSFITTMSHHVSGGLTPYITDRTICVSNTATERHRGTIRGNRTTSRHNKGQVHSHCTKVKIVLLCDSGSPIFAAEHSLEVEVLDMPQATK